MDTSLHEAVKRKDFEAVCQRISDSANPSEYVNSVDAANWPALYYCFSGKGVHIEILRELLKAGARTDYARTLPDPLARLQDSFKGFGGILAKGFGKLLSGFIGGGMPEGYQELLLRHAVKFGDVPALHVLRSMGLILLIPTRVTLPFLTPFARIIR